MYYIQGQIRITNEFEIVEIEMKKQDTILGIFYNQIESNKSIGIDLGQRWSKDMKRDFYLINKEKGEVISQMNITNTFTLDNVFIFPCYNSEIYKVYNEKFMWTFRASAGGLHEFEIFKSKIDKKQIETDVIILFN